MHTILKTASCVQVVTCCVEVPHGVQKLFNILLFFGGVFSKNLHSKFVRAKLNHRYLPRPR